MANNILYDALSILVKMLAVKGVFRRLQARLFNKFGDRPIVRSNAVSN
jgi:hypothetical protein